MHVEINANPIRWSTVARTTLTRAYPVTLPMVALMLLVPVYLFIAQFARVGPVYAPEIFLDRAVPLQPFWALVYGSVYLFLILLPVFVIRQEEHIRRTFHAYLIVWLAAYVCFLLYPTIAPRPVNVIGEGFAVWGLRLLYSADPPYNCFPSIHVAHSFVSALTCYRVHRGLGIAGTFCAFLVAISTLFTKQHYIADVVAGALLAYVAYVVFLRSYSRERFPELDRRIAPYVAAGTIGIVALGIGCYWLAYQVTARWPEVFGRLLEG
jgi:membrane-associated phospholipid phosphatase